MRRPQIGRFALILVVVAVLIGTAGLIWGNIKYVQQGFWGREFAPFWVGTRGWWMDGVQVYDPVVSEEAMNLLPDAYTIEPLVELTGKFTQPFYSVLFWLPFSLFNFETAKVVMLTLSEIAVVLIVIIGFQVAKWEVTPIRIGGAILFGLLWFHGAVSLTQGGIQVFAALLVCLGLFLIQEKQDVPAGIMLFLAAMLPDMVVFLIPLVIFWSISTKRTGILAGLLGTAVLVVGGSVLVNPSWLGAYVAQILDLTGMVVNGSPVAMMAAGLPSVGGMVEGVLFIVLFLYMILEWVQVWGKGEQWFTWTALMTLVITSLLWDWGTTAAYQVLLPAVFIIFQVWIERWKRLGKIVSLVVILFLFFGLWGIHIGHGEWFVETQRMFTITPVVVLIGLLWVRWWAVRPQKLMLETFAEQMKGTKK